MKKIIDGKMYNTDTAKQVGSWWNGLGTRDFGHCYEDLYQKKTGEFFLHGQGGPSSKYAKSCGQNSWSGGEMIIPLSFDTAREWAEEHLDADDYEKIFGEVSESDDKKVIAVSLTEGSVALVKRKAAQEGISVSAYIEKLITDAV